ncbi:hypothetical protein ABPG73_005285 [Tetrahymena malaccensis]
MNNMNNSILQNLNQINNDQCHTDNEYSSSRISFQDQKKIFEFYDNKFGKEGLVGDHDDEIQEKQVCQDEVKIHENEAHQIQNQLSIIQKENQEQNKESFKNISKPFMKNFSYQNTNEQNKLYLNYKLTFFKKPSINSINSKSLRSSDNKNRYDLSDSQRLINLNQNKRSDQIIEEEYNQKIEISSNLVKENFKKKVISQSDSKELNDKLSIIHKFMQMKGVNLELQRRVKHYLHFLSQESKDRNKQEEDLILQMLSNKLRDEVLKEINQKVIQQINCLFNCFSNKVIQELIFNIEEILVQPNQIIFKEGEIDEDQCMYFIWNGKVEIFYSDISKQKLNSSKTLTTLEANQTFGEISFYTGFARSASARSVNLATLYKISRVKFLKILSHHLGDFEKFKMIEEQIKSQDNLSAIQLECYYCKQQGHLSVKCPIINACFDRQLIILKNNYSIFQQRQKIVNGSIFSQSTLRKRQKIHSIQLVEINIQISKKLKQQAVYLGSKIFKMFEKNSIESENDEEGDQITTKKKNLDDLSSDSSQSSNNSIESQSQTSINNIKVTSKKQKQVKTKSKSISDNKISIENQNSKLIDHDQIKAATSDQSQKSSVNLNEIQIEKQISYNQNNEKYNQRQSQQLSQENKSQDKFQSNILNQSSELVINHREGISERKISQQASIQQSSMQLNQLCSSLINIVKQQEIQIQTLNQQRENQKHSLNNSKSQDDFCDPNKQTQIVVQDDILNEFDKSKNFLHFFPHNNLRTVLKQIKIQQQKKNNINIKNKIAQQPRRRQNVNFTQSIFEKKSKMVIENQDLIEYLNKSKPTFCSYGFYIKNCSLYPLRASQ